MASTRATPSPASPRGDLDDSEGIVCTVHGPKAGYDQDDDPEGHAELEAQALEVTTDELTCTAQPVSGMAARGRVGLVGEDHIRPGTRTTELSPNAQAAHETAAVE
ncbi:hypothetical protein ACFYZE_35095 [Streptomyces sp. NPDC001796]|uniref:hypothetical protein n=1 Tax=Streptomyces sp. NPDC001796 TaxID=3364609 RepID=UPI00367875CB